MADGQAAEDANSEMSEGDPGDKPCSAYASKSTGQVAGSDDTGANKRAHLGDAMDEDQAQQIISTISKEASNNATVPAEICGSGGGEGDVVVVVVTGEQGTGAVKQVIKAASPFKAQVRMAEDTLDGPCGKKRCADRYDSSESSDR